MVRSPLANRGDLRNVGSSLGRDDPLEEGIATSSGILAGESQAEESGGLWSMGSWRAGYD